MNSRYPDKKDKELIKAFSVLQNEKEIQSLLRDVFSLKELKEASNRFKIATMLWQGDKTYLEIAAECATSTTTVTRVADWLYHKNQKGYQTVLERMFPKTR